MADLTGEIVDLRDGFRVEVTPLVMPAGKFEARLFRRRYTPGDRTTWKQVGPMVVADGPEAAAQDLLTAVNEGLLAGVEAKG